MQPAERCIQTPKSVAPPAPRPPPPRPPPPKLRPAAAAAAAKAAAPAAAAPLHAAPAHAEPAAAAAAAPASPACALTETTSITICTSHHYPVPPLCACFKETILHCCSKVGSAPQTPPAAAWKHSCSYVGSKIERSAVTAGCTHHHRPATMIESFARIELANFKHLRGRRRRARAPRPWGCGRNRVHGEQLVGVYEEFVARSIARRQHALRHLDREVLRTCQDTTLIFLAPKLNACMVL